MTKQLYAWEFRTELDQEDQSLRDYLHDNKTFHAFPTKEDALAHARTALEQDVANRENDDGEPVVATIDVWSRTAGEGCPQEEYSDGGVWYECSDGEQGRVVIHTILVQP